MTLIIGGLDLSLSSTGIARIDLADRVTTFAYKPRSRGYQRLTDITAVVLSELKDCDVIGIEGLITHAKGSSLTDIAGLWWHVTLEMWGAGFIFVPISPSTLKGYATGNGLSDKFKMHAAAMTRLGAVVDGPDQADALWAAAATADHYGQPLAQMPQAQRAWLHRNAVKGRRKGLPVVDWPDLPAEWRDRTPRIAALSGREDT